VTGRRDRGTSPPRHRYRRLLGKPELMSFSGVIGWALLVRDVPAERIFRSEADTEQIWKAA